MYPRGSGSYGQPSYPGQPSFGQNSATGYAGNSSVRPESGSQLSMGSHHPSILGSSRDQEIGGYRAHPSAAQYGAQYSLLYGSTALNSGQQASSLAAKGSVQPALEGRSNYGSNRTDSPKYASADYVSSSTHVYDPKSGFLMQEKLPDYASLERRQYAERQSAYAGRDLPEEAGGRYADSVGYTPQHKSEMYDRLDQAALLRHNKILKSQSLQSSPHDNARQADYLAARSGSFRHPTQELAAYGGRVDADPRVSLVENSSYSGQPPPSILGAAPQRNVNDLLYAQTSSNPGYGVSLPPGRDYGIGKGLHGAVLESDFPGSLSSRSGLSRIDDLKDDRYARELDLRDEERRKERLRDRERELERDRERKREREREREREKKRQLRDKKIRERDQERKRALESRRERTPPRASNDRRGSSLSKDVKSSRRDSPRREALHRIHSPVKRREYLCKVHASRLVDAERDYMSLDKRYPRLYISPDFSKVIINWPRGNLKLSMHTPVSFEHDFVEEESVADEKDSSDKRKDVKSVNSEHKNIVWNAKLILLSGLSKSAIEDLSSDHIADDRAPHICNILRFAIMKQGSSLMAIGGPWDAVDGGDPSVDDSSLVRTILRYAKNLSNLDLQSCQNWNRFLEIHYDRIGEDGLFSHKEVTVFFVPDLSNCLPSINAWREQWLTYKKAVAERERQLSLGKEKLKSKKDVRKGMSTPKNAKKPGKGEKNKEIADKKEADDKPDVHSGKANKSQTAKLMDTDGDTDITVTVKEAVEPTKDVKNVEEKGEVKVNTSTSGSIKAAKKKIVRRIVKEKVADKKVSGENGTDDKLDMKAAESTITGAQQDASSAVPKTLKKVAKKRVVKKVAVAEADSTEGKSEVKTEISSVNEVPQGPVKKMVKRKIIRKVPKKKVVGGVPNSEAGDDKTLQSEDRSTANAGNVIDKAVDIKLKEKKVSEGNNEAISESSAQSRKDDRALVQSKIGKTLNKVTGTEEKKTVEKGAFAVKMASSKENITDKELSKGKEKAKGDKEKKEKDEKDDLRSKPSKDTDRKKSDEPPRHPGFILQTKSNKDTKLRSLSLSLDSLLEYSERDMEEETFELSVFAESFYEMLQYEMGCRVLTFLKKLCVKFITKRNRRKREREQNADKPKKENTKRLKTEAAPSEDKADKSQVKDESQPRNEKLAAKEDTMESEEDAEGEKVKLEDDEEIIEEEDVEEDPEEDPEEDESSEESEEEENMDTKQDQMQSGRKGTNTQNSEEKRKDIEKKISDSSKSKEPIAEPSNKSKSATDKGPVDKELIQAFRFFDRNRAGYLRVEDLRVIIHNLGKFLPHRDVKELVQSALLESSTGRDDRILYEKLVKMSLEI